MLIKVIMCELPDCSLGFHRQCCLLSLFGSLTFSLSEPSCSFHTFVVLSLFVSLGVCNSQICAVIITHHYGSNRDVHEKPASVRREEGGGERGEKARRKGKRSVTAEAQRVGGECRGGRTWSWLRCSLQLVSSH